MDILLVGYKPPGIAIAVARSLDAPGIARSAPDGETSGMFSKAEARTDKGCRSGEHEPNWISRSVRSRFVKASTSIPLRTSSPSWPCRSSDMDTSSVLHWRGRTNVGPDSRWSRRKKQGALREGRRTAAPVPSVRARRTPNAEKEKPSPSKPKGREEVGLSREGRTAVRRSFKRYPRSIVRATFNVGVVDQRVTGPVPDQYLDRNSFIGEDITGQSSRPRSPGQVWQ